MSSPSYLKPQKETTKKQNENKKSKCSKSHSKHKKSAKPVFMTAAWTKQKAIELTREQAKKNPETLPKEGETKPCPTCQGVKKAYGCFTCKDKLNLTRQDFIHYFFEKNVWCKCGNHGDEDDEASDGRKIFGNETYLCGSCGMVVQFG